MTLVFQDLRVPLELEGTDPARLAGRRLGLPVEHARILRKSLDARVGRDPVYVYALELTLSPRHEKLALHGRHKQKLRRSGPARIPEVFSDERPEMPGRPVIVGGGPAGLFAAWRLVREGFAPILIERGPDITARGRRWADFVKGGAFDAECNLLFGEGGAGAFSDGKLTTRIKDPRVADVLEVLVTYGAPEACQWLAAPHIGSNALPAIIRRMRSDLQRRGLVVRFDTKVDGLTAKNGRLAGVRCGEREVPAGAVVLGIGHSARDTMEMLLDEGVAAEAKPFQTGLRIEHPQALIDKLQYGDSCGHTALPVAEYALRSRDRKGARSDVFSFCMCPGGEILPAMEREGFMCVNGASPKARDGQFANSGLVVTVIPDVYGTDPRDGLRLQRQLESRAWDLGGGGFAAPAQRVTDFLAGRVSESLGKTSYPLPLTSAPLDEVLPVGVADSLRAALLDIDRRLPGFAGEHGMLVGPESRSSSPVRLLRDAETLESPSHPGLFPVGEGAGHAGGIMSAAVDGLRVADALVRRWRAEAVPSELV
jgi:uncharacterized protein